MSTIKNVEIQLIDNDARTTTIKLDNPKTNITKPEIITVFSTAISNNWLLSNYGNPIQGIGQVQLTTSEKILLEGDPVYVTPSTLSFTLTNQKPADNKTVTVSGGPTIQGYNIRNLTNANLNYKITIASDGLSIQVIVLTTDLSAGDNGSFDLDLVVQGKIITVPCTFAKS